MTIREVIGSAEEPISLDSAKEHLRVTNTDEDSYIVELITVARSYVENEIGQTLHKATYNYYLDSFPTGNIEVPLPPLTSVTHVKYYDSDNSLQTLVAGTNYRVDANSIPGIIEVIDSWPATYDRTSAVQIQFIGGESDYLQIDKNTLHDIKLKLAMLYDDRQGEDDKKASVLQNTLNKLKRPSF
jgi:uncharacterized phiE125 gp8 family phage protein